MEQDRQGSSKDIDSSGEIDLDQRLRYLLLGEEDARILRDLKTSFEEISDDFVNDFYNHLKSFPEANDFLRDSAIIENLKEMQKKHLLSMVNAKWDQAYVRDREKVGHSHSSRGVASYLVLGGFYQYARMGIAEILASSSDGDINSESPYPKINALLKVIFLDIGLTLDAYFKQSTFDLEKALEMLWRSNAELKQFAQLASHDLKTPLATVSNICEEILDEYQDIMPGDTAELVSVAQKTVLNMSTVINELLSATSVLFMEPDDFVEPVQSQEVVESVLERLTTRAGQREITITVSEDLPKLIAHEVFLSEVLFNLITNAIKYIDKKPGRIEVLSEVRDKEAILIVQDNGPGIPQENLTQIFSPFKRLNQHQKIPGSGLGLYYSKHLIEKQGGRIWAESEQGNGSQFFIALPISE
jgi:signal transduction histidine kinase